MNECWNYEKEKQMSFKAIQHVFDLQLNEILLIKT